MEYALKWCAAYYGSGSKAKLTIKQDFAKGKIDLDTLKFYWEMVLANRMSMETFHELLTTEKCQKLAMKKSSYELRLKILIDLWWFNSQE